MHCIRSDYYKIPRQDFEI